MDKIKMVPTWARPTWEKSNGLEHQHVSPSVLTARKPSGLGLDVPLMINGLRLKADAARWAAQRTRMIANGTDFCLEILPQDKEFIRKGKAAGVFLWMLTAHARRPDNINDYDLIATCYTTLAEAVALADVILSSEVANADEIVKSLTLVANAQFALRIAVGKCPGRSDEDQQAVFQAVRDIAEERHIYIQAGLKLNHPVDPFDCPAIASTVQSLTHSFREREENERRTAKLLKNIKYKAGQLAGLADEPAPEAWIALTRMVGDLIASGYQPSRIELREALTPIADLLPFQVEVSKEVGLVLREIERFRFRESVQTKDQSSKAPTGDVKSVADLLKGRTIVLIGGEERSEATRAIEQAFGLKRVVWISTSDHESYRNFEPHISRSDVAAVVLMIRWASHSFANVRILCDRHGKPFVRLPNGYNPNQVAAAIMSQASNRIGRAN